MATAPGQTQFPATSLKAEGETEITVEALLEGFARHFLDWTNRWLDEGFAPVRAAWLERAKGIGGPISVRLPNATLRGTFKDLDRDGTLLLEMEGEGGLRRIAVGDVFFG